MQFSSLADGPTLKAEEHAMKSRMLFVSGKQADANRLAQMLRALPVTLDHVENLQQARLKVQQQDYDVILTEAHLPDGNWLDALHLARDIRREVQVIVTDENADAR